MTQMVHEQLIERMPDVARGAERWSHDEGAHIAACADCRDAWAVIRASFRLGAEIEARFDAAGAGEGVVRRLREAGSRRRTLRRSALGLFAVAAALLVVLGGRRIGGGGSTAAPAVEARFLPELDSLTTDELATVAEEIDAPASQLDLIEGQPLFELDSTQLERVLRSLEG
jgi:hypothetical protein